MLVFLAQNFLARALDFVRLPLSSAARSACLLLAFALSLSRSLALSLSRFLALDLITPRSRLPNLFPRDKYS